MTRLQRLDIKDTVVFFGSARTLSRSAALKNLKELKRKYADVKKPNAKIVAEIKAAEMDLEMSKILSGCGRTCVQTYKMVKEFKKRK